MSSIRIKLLIPRTGPAGPQNIGDEIEVASAEAGRMIEAGQAIPVRDEPVERAVKARTTRARKAK